MQTATPVPALVVPETRRLAYLANWSLRVVLLLGVMAALASQATAAPVVFDVSAQSGEGWAVSGTVTIDTATGKVLSADLTAKDGSSTVIFDTVYYGTVTHSTRPGEPVWTKMFFEAEAEAGIYSLLLTVPEATWVVPPITLLGESHRDCREPLIRLSRAELSNRIPPNTTPPGTGFSPIGEHGL
jgi:hypothetical protein